MKSVHRKFKFIYEFLKTFLMNFCDSSLISKQKAYRDVSREIQNLRCQEAKVHVQYQMLDIKLSVMEESDENDLVDGIDLMEPKLSTLSRMSTSVTQVCKWENLQNTNILSICR